MRRPPEPVFNVLQALIRTVLLESRPSAKHSGRICTRCLRSQNQGSRQQIRTPRLRPAAAYHSHFRSRRIRRQPRDVGIGRPFGRCAFATVSDGTRVRIAVLLLRLPLMRYLVSNSRGPLEEYDERVYARILRDDDHQRGMRLINMSVEGPWLTSIRHCGALAGSA